MHIGRRGLTKPQLIAYLGFAAIAVGLMAYAVKAGMPLRYGDEKDYLEIAQGLVDGKGYQLYGGDSAYRPPAWPLTLALFLALGLPQSLLPVLPMAFLVIAALAAGAVGIRIVGHPVGAIAAPAVLLYPLSAYTATTLYPQAMATAALLLLILFAFRTEEHRPLSRSACCAVGLLLVIEVLSVPTMGFTALILAGWLFLRQRGNRVRYALFGGAAALIPLLAWTIRNAIQVGSPVLISTSGGQNLLIGNNPNATASSGVGVDIDAQLNAAQSLSEVARDEYLRGSAVDWIRANPGHALQLYVEKILNYFAPYNPPTTAVAERDSSLQIAILVFAFVALILGTVVRLALRRRLPIHPTEWVIIGLFVANAPVMAVFFTRTRFRQPLDAMLWIEAAVAVALLLLLAQAALTRKRSGVPQTID